MRTLSMYEPRGPHWGGGGFMSRSPPSHPKMRDHQVERGRLLGRRRQTIKGVTVNATGVAVGARRASAVTSTVQTLWACP